VTSRASRHRTQKSGQALVEFALVAPFFFLLLLGIIEGGRLVFHYHTLGNATREGARYAIVHGANAADGCPSGPLPGSLVNPCDPSADNVRAAVVEAAFSLVDVTEFKEILVEYDPANARGDRVHVQVEYVYRPIMPLFPPFSIIAETTLVINN
jgi:hypothetical protein